MPVQGPDIREVAIILLAHPGSVEACLRTAIGRLYYAAFTSALPLFEPMLVQKNPLQKNTHKDLPFTIEHHSFGNDAVLAKQITDLHELRKAADYDVNLSVHAIEIRFKNADLLASQISTNLSNIGGVPFY